jgi:hypothetical protein
MIANAMESPTDMLHLRDQEARAIMAPHDATPVTAGLEDLFPHVPGPNGTRVGTDPEVAKRHPQSSRGNSCASGAVPASRPAISRT